ncbi:MAG: penicillin-binding protein activator LpoB [Deltaproteobacteria bacterium]|nr:penicillin-binding protein activator LpoB [Deltaproteobacteria bacterium]
MKQSILILFCCFLSLLSGCATKTVDRVETTKTIDLSGRWNDTDSRLVSEQMISDALSRPWLKKFIRNNKGEMPTVIVGTVKNRSHEHINIQTFVKDLERALINSGEVEFVASKGEREELREERKDQATHSSEKTAKSEGEEIGADFMLKGTINTILDKISGKSVMFYQVNLELIAIETHKKVWIGDKKIKKFIKKSRFGL